MLVELDLDIKNIVVNSDIPINELFNISSLVNPYETHFTRDNIFDLKIETTPNGYNIDRIAYKIFSYTASKKKFNDLSNLWDDPKTRHIILDYQGIEYPLKKKLEMLLELNKDLQNISIDSNTTINEVFDADVKKLLNPIGLMSNNRKLTLKNFSVKKTLKTIVSKTPELSYKVISGAEISIRKAYRIFPYIANYTKNTIINTQERIKTFKEEYTRLSNEEAQRQALPPPDDELWNDSELTRIFFQKYLDESFKIGTDKSYNPCEMSGSITYQPWQIAASIPIERVKQFLIVASTGTGKSLVWTKIAFSMVNQKLNVIVLNKDQSAAGGQLQELKKSPDWANINIDKIISIGVSPLVSEKKVIFCTYAQAGNAYLKDPECFKNSCIVIDEIHELANPKDFLAWGKSVEVVVDCLNKRKYAKLIGLTATPLVNISSWLNLMNMFRNEQDPPFTSDFISIEKNEESLEQKNCSLTQGSTIKLQGPLRGVQMCMYSSERDEIAFAKYDSIEYVYFNVSDPGALRKQKWTKNSLQHWIRLKHISAKMLPHLIKNINSKALVFLSTKFMAKEIYNGLKNSPDFEKKLILLTDDDTINKQNKKKAEFAHADNETTLVTHMVFAQSHTFESKPPQKRGAREIHSVMLPTNKEMLQLRGRAWRFCSHYNYPVEDRTINQFIYIPMSEDNGMTCEEAMINAAEQEKQIFDTLTHAMYDINYLRDAAWERRPLSITGDNKTMSDTQFTDAIVNKINMLVSKTKSKYNILRESFISAYNNPTVEMN